MEKPRRPIDFRAEQLNRDFSRCNTTNRKGRLESAVNQVLKNSMNKPSVLEGVDQENLNQMLNNSKPLTPKKGADFRSGMLDGFKPF